MRGSRSASSSSPKRLSVDPATGWRLRRAGSANAAACSLVASATFLETFAGTIAADDIVAHTRTRSNEAAFSSWIADPASVVTLAEAEPGSAPIGYSVVTAPDLPVALEANDVELKRIYLLAPWQGQGVAGALMERAVADATVLGASRLLLGVYEGNQRARRFYDRQGFEVVGTRRFLVGASWFDDLVFARNL
jgi:diamine N-acetyltransferase